MKAVLVNASPRKNRNTATILERVREGLEERARDLGHRLAKNAAFAGHFPA